jgi:hypothetical protein
VAALVAALAATAAAQPDDAAKNAARELAEEGAKAMEAQDFARAQDLYHRAYALVPAPTLSVRRARALEKAGRWVEALEAYVRTTRTSLDADAPPAFREAVAEAHAELAALRPRVPRAVIVIKGVDRKSNTLTVTVDGKPLSAALLGVPAPIDPGEHELVATTTSGGEARAKLVIGEREKKTVELVLPAGTEPEVEAAAPSVEPVRADTGTPPPPSSQKTWALVAMGVGALGLGVGVTTGVMATSKHQSAEDGCPNGTCPPGSTGADDAESFRSLRAISTIGYVVGVVGVGAGATLWLTAPKRPARVGVWMGPAAAGVRGSF